MNILKFLIILFSLAPAPAPAKKLRLRPAPPHCINQYWKLEQRNRIILLRICSFSAEPEPNLHTGYANTGCVLLLFPASHLCLMVGYRQARVDSTPVNSFSCTHTHNNILNITPTTTTTYESRTVILRSNFKILSCLK